MLCGFLHILLFVVDYRETGFANKKILKRLGEQKCYEKFDEAVALINTEEMWGEYVVCVLSICSDDQPIPKTVLGELRDQSLQQRLDQAYSVVTNAHSLRKLSSSLYPNVVDFLLKHHHVDKAKVMLNKISKERKDPEILLKKIEIFLLSIKGEAKWKSEKLYLSALEVVHLMTIEQQVTFYRMWIEYAIAHNQPTLAKQIVTTHSLRCSVEAKSAMLSIYLRWLTAKSGIVKAYRVSDVKL